MKDIFGFILGLIAIAGGIYQIYKSTLRYGANVFEQPPGRYYYWIPIIKTKRKYRQRLLTLTGIITLLLGWLMLRESQM